ncbi:MAG: pitrilysin family protein [Phycisphaerae bacterium]|nr:pitrilysin family protein [Phycisphaerae bacterium]MDD5381668.1 pitrilysin family protein [Phycisphaerae bacterium]
MTERLDKHILKNGMVVLGEPMEAVGSVAFDFMLPAGAARFPDGCCGAGSVIADWIFRGAGDKNNRSLGDALDGLGLHRSSSVGSSHTIIGAVLESGNLAEAIELYADIILRAGLKEDQFELARQLAIDGVHALDDDPRQKVMLKLREQFYPDPLGRSALGEIAELKTLTAEKTRRIIKNNFTLSQTIFAVAGKYDFDAVVAQIERLFSNVKKQSQQDVIPQQNKAGKYTHLHNDGAQVHIGLMTETVKPADEDYYNARVAVSVLSGGMSARLFTEVREKRGLCYAVAAKYHSLKEAAGIMCYAGTTPDKAQETLDVITDQFNRLGVGISEEEIERAKVGLKSTLVLQSESSGSRAAGIGGDYYILGRVRSLDEIKNKIEQTTVDSILGFLRRNPFKDFTAVTIGPKEIKIY